jgi:signal transduction histidine kinase
MNAPDRLAVLAHELRSPVAALAAVAEAASLARPDPVRARRLVELAVAAVRNIERLLGDVAFMSVERRRIDAVEVVSASVETWRLGGHSVTLSGTETAQLTADPHRLRQAVDNLVGNAVGHSPEGSEVAVVISRTGRGVTIEVVDRGEGIAAADQARVFESGIRLTDARPGSGIGLAVVLAVAEAHGGVVELQSAPGAGSTFRLVLPSGDGRDG